ncbi:hypothetical protein ACIQ7Q_07245 [Streptomyces sp. NPDC096176]|uniref:hypothetical protein n=1 Tax=Streptomyces sp. NPDC096176 TaxID=3366079 RepID=UPI0037F17A0E
MESQPAGLDGFEGFELAITRDGPVIVLARVLFLVQAVGRRLRGLRSVRLGQEMAVRGYGLGELLVGRILARDELPDLQDCGPQQCV